LTSLTLDSISLRNAGVVQITQSKKGHRLTLDSILLADFCRLKPGARILEPGAGSGVISILLAKKFPATAFFAVEVQQDLVRLCRENVLRNDLEGRVSVLEGNLGEVKRSSAMPETFDAIVANPPYTRSGAGRQSPDAGRQIARHNQSGSLETWLDLGTSLRNRGAYFLVFPAARTGELLSLLRERKLEPKRLRFVHPQADKPASIVLVEAKKTAGVGLEVMPPLIVHAEGGGYSEEVRTIYGPS